MIRYCTDNCPHPQGVYTIESMIGSTVRVKSLPVVNRFGGIDSGRLYKISDINFIVSEDGKTVTRVFLEGTDCVFTFKDIEIVRVNYTEPEDQPENNND